jgi:UDPglucose 6-dehydrogenase
MVKVGVVGTGFVGLTHAAVTSMFGHDVIGYDSNLDKINAFNSHNKSWLESYISEKGLSDIVNEQLRVKRLSFSSNPNVLVNRDIFFMCLPTPYKPNGESDLSYLFSATDTISDILLKREKNDFVLFVNKSTVPIGTAKKLNDYLLNKGLTNFDVASNPEFLPEGDAVNSAIHSHKVIVGANRRESFDLLRRVYSGFTSSTGYIETNSETAEAIKYASNALLFTQIVTWQAIPGKIGEAYSDVDFDTLRKGIIADDRIAKWGSYISAGAGGSCFKKDALSLAFQLTKQGVDSSFVEHINNINEYHKSYLIERSVKEANYNFNTKRVALLGTAFKQDTNDMRESNVLKIVPELLMRGVEEIKIYDSLALDEAKKYFDPKQNQNYTKISYHSTAKDALINSDVSFIATDHKEFRSIADIIETYTNKPHLIIDGRRMISQNDVNNLLSCDISYLPIGGTFRKSF